MNFRCSLATLMISVSLFRLRHFNRPWRVCPLGRHPTEHRADRQRHADKLGKTDRTQLLHHGSSQWSDFALRLYSFIHKGTCQQPGPVAFAMNDKVNTQREPVRGWSFSRSAPIALQDLLSSEYSIVVRTAPESGNVDIFAVTSSREAQ